jgi:hypothetical protein
MKSRILIFAVITSIFFTDCNKDDSCNCIESHPIVGTWNLINVNGGLIGIDIDYTIGEVKWTFDDGSQELTIENNILTTGPEDIYAGLDSGIYNYEIQEIGDTEKLFIDGNERGTILIMDNSLIIDDGVALDGFFSVFESE